MIRLCLNCDTENPADAVICSECGMSLTRAPIGETAEKARIVEDVQDTAVGREKWPRRTARILTLIFGALTTVMLATTPDVWESLEQGLAVEGGRRALPFTELTGWGSGAYIVIAVLVLGSWAVAVIPWRWEAVGGVLLLLWAGILLPSGYDLLFNAPLSSEPRIAVYTFATCFPGVFLLTLPAGLWGLIAGSLFLVGWRKSRALVAPQATQ